MKKVKTLMAIALLLAFAVSNVSILSSDAEAGSAEPTFSAGYKLYGADGSVIGCDCPALVGHCVCKNTPIT